MRLTFTKAILAGLLITLSCVAGAQQPQSINPATQIQWPKITGNGTPTSLSLSCSPLNYGQPYQNTGVTPNTTYTCGSDGWAQRGSGGGGGGAVNGVIVTTSTTASCGQLVRVNNGSTPVTITMPPGPPTGCQVVVERQYNSSATVTISPNGVPYDGVTTQLPVAEAVLVWTDGTNYHSSVPVIYGAGFTITPAATGLGLAANGVGPYPSTTNFIFVSFSGLFDDNHVLSTAVPVSSISCDGVSLCTVNTSSAHGLVVNSLNNGFVDLSQITGWGATGQSTNKGSFKVASTPTSTQFTVASNRSSFSCSSSCGNIYNAGYWAIYQTATEPFIKNSGGTVIGIEDTATDLNTNFSTLVAPLCGLTGPNYLILLVGANDANIGSTAATIEGYLVGTGANTGIWYQAHTAGCKVLQGTFTAANYGFATPEGVYQTIREVNRWIPKNAKSATNASTGQYWDGIIDYNGTMAWAGGQNGNYLLGGDTNSAYQFAQITNAALANQQSMLSGPWAGMYGQDGGNAIGFDVGGGWQFYGDTTNYFMGWNKQGVWLHQTPGSGASLLQDIPTQSPSGTWDVCPYLMGQQFDPTYGGTNTAEVYCWHNVGSGNAQNYAWFGGTQYAAFPIQQLFLYMDGTLGFPGYTVGGSDKYLGLDHTNNKVKIMPTPPLSSTQTTVSCSTSGTAVFSQTQTTVDNRVLIHLSACLGTASYTYPVAYTNTPSVFGSNNVAATVATSVSTSAVTVTGATSTGALVLEDY